MRLEMVEAKRIPLTPRTSDPMRVARALRSRVRRARYVGQVVRVEIARYSKRGQIVHGRSKHLVRCLLIFGIRLRSLIC